MSETKQILDAVMRAMELEKETFDYYVAAGHRTFNEAGKRMFAWLARTEEQHYQKLTELYATLHESGRWVFYGGTTVELEPVSSAVSFDTDDIQALKIALEIERRGLAYYEELAAATSDPDGRSMLQTLRNEEQEHIRILSDMLQQLQA